eukprot:CAMPEP_0171098400 /NCGR_PEP_ID=MMETSP0766_2-20121228/48156_1 /TAXON_ID=439317 /ORGANISM="Gambierdiscus australes, Strain CAWD 149" /LENGTH=128 /DNA_ID=CAMNT_0011557733 /DNA_START=61 /DNA_END=447 /DNA_ORIENTATION=+
MALALTPEQHQNVVEHEGYLYATLDFADPELWEWQPADRDFRRLPEGWELAPDDPVIHREVIGAHPWGTACCVVDSGEAYSTKLWMNGGSKVSNFELEAADVDGAAEYRPRRCLKSRPSRVMIRTRNE